MNYPTPLEFLRRVPVPIRSAQWPAWDETLYYEMSIWKALHAAASANNYKRDSLERPDSFVLPHKAYPEEWDDAQSSPLAAAIMSLLRTPEDPLRAQWKICGRIGEWRRYHVVLKSV